MTICSSRFRPGQLRDTLVQCPVDFRRPQECMKPLGALKKHISVATAVVGTRGGVGASTLATSLAWLFSADQQATNRAA